jgi:hypothetical protein
MPHTAIAVDDHERTGIGHDRNALIELQLVGHQRAHVAGHDAQAMGIVAAHVGHDQVIGRNSRLLLVGTGGAPQIVRPAANGVGVEHQIGFQGISSGLGDRPACQTTAAAGPFEVLSLEAGRRDATL